MLFCSVVLFPFVKTHSKWQLCKSSLHFRAL
uniref:Uncharacterized protein n=1 Tax=Anguilla anguilla TaxID=7936 RepID=A0A0E9QU16_ANGAN